MRGANVVLKEDLGLQSAQRPISQTGQNRTTAGFSTKSAVAPRKSATCEAFAWVGDRYALTGAQGGYGWYGNRQNDETRVLGTTDRPVYRPGSESGFSPDSGEPARRWRRLETARWPREFNRARDQSQRRKVFRNQSSRPTNLAASAANSPFPKEAPLGEFHRCRLSDDNEISAATRNSASKNTSGPNLKSRLRRPKKPNSPAKPSRRASTPSIISARPCPMRR